MDPVRLLITAHPAERIPTDHAVHLCAALVLLNQRQAVGTIGRIRVSAFVCQPLFDTRLGLTRRTLMKLLTADLARLRFTQVAFDEFPVAILMLCKVKNALAARFGAKHQIFTIH